ncbi:MAG: ATP-binding protein [Gallionella sp.]
MLIEFSVENFLSFREKQTFSMIAAPRLGKKGNVFKPDVQGEKLPDLLKIAAIYGANASGKSNLIAALELVKSFASLKPSAQLTSLPVSPFRFDPLLADQPSRIELHFVTAGQRYAFELAATKEKIVEERLTAFPRGKETLLYQRIYADAGDQYKMGKSLEGGAALHKIWEQLTSEQTLFIAQAVANSSNTMNQLREPFRWLQNGIFVVEAGMDTLVGVSKLVGKFMPKFIEEIPDFLQAIDVPVVGIKFESMPNFGQQIMATQEKIILTHKTALGEAEFDFQEESKGTQNLIGFWSPWTWMLGGQKTLVIDELDSSLHPNIVSSLINKHLAAEQPTQLIFTTHNTRLMQDKWLCQESVWLTQRELRRDQFWLTERDENGATQLRSVHDFEGRESENLEKRYYEGRYRSLPFIR